LALADRFSVSPFGKKLTKTVKIINKNIDTLWSLNTQFPHMEGSKFEKVGQEQRHFVILERRENGVPIIFKVPLDQRKDFERIAVNTTNNQFSEAANHADRDGHAVIRDIPLGARVATLGFTKSSHGYGVPAYKITFLGLPS
jgi:hypothetical protein